MNGMKRKYASEGVYPISMEWTIKKDNLIVESPEVTIPNLPDVSFHLSLNSNAGKKEDQANVYFHLKSAKDDAIIVNAILSCRSAIFDHEWTHTFKKDNEIDYYGTQICFTDELLDPEYEFFVNNQMVLILKGTLKIETINEVSSSSKASKHESLGHILWETEKDKDLIIAVGDRELKAHKVILKRRSTKFAKRLAELEESKKEHTLPSTDILAVQNHKLNTVKEGIMFCYDIQNSDTLSATDAAQLLNFAHEYEIKDLKQNIEEFCMENLCTSNACLFANASITAKADKLYQKCFDLIFHCMKNGDGVKDIKKINPELKDKLFFKCFCAVYEA